MQSADKEFPLRNSRRILCAAQVLGTFVGGGAQRLAYNLALGLAQEGKRSIAISLRAKGREPAEALPNFKMIQLKADRFGPFGLLVAALRLRFVIQTEAVDILHVHGVPSLPLVALATRFMQKRPSLLFSWHDSESVLEQIGWRRTLLIWALRQCDRVSGSSQHVAEALRTRAGLRDVGIFHGGVPFSPERLEPKSAEPIILWLGRIVPPKDPQILIRSVAKLKARGLRFTVFIVGKPIPSTSWYMQDTKDLVDQLCLADVVNVVGYIPDIELHRLMSRAQIGVHTSHTEGFSLSILEQMMAGLSVIATNVGDTSCAIENGVTGLLIPPRDEEHLVNALRCLLTNVELRRSLGQSARKRAIEKFSIVEMARRVAAEYDQIATKT